MLQDPLAKAGGFCVSLGNNCQEINNTMEKINEKREFPIDNKIFTKDNILDLIKLFGKLSNEILDKSKEIRYKDLIRDGWNESNIKERDIDTSYSNLVFTSYDNSIYTGTLDDIIKGYDILDDKEIVEINLQFFERVFNSHFIIRIKHDESDSLSSSSYFSVEGQDRNWVNGTSSLIEDYLSKCRSQSGFVSKFRIPIIVITVIILIFFLFNLTEFFIKTNLSFPRIIDNKFNKHLIPFILVSSLIAVSPAILFTEWLKKLFPRIEIQTGENFHQIKRDKRKKLLIMISVILIPTVISFLLRLITD
jgi:hypothetical protein